MNVKMFKKILIEHGKTQSDIANLLNRDKSMITNVMKGRRELKASEVQKIADYLKIPVSDLLQGSFSDSSDGGFIHSSVNQSKKLKELTDDELKDLARKLAQTTITKFAPLEISDDIKENYIDALYQIYKKEQTLSGKHEIPESVAEWLLFDRMNQKL